MLEVTRIKELARNANVVKISQRASNVVFYFDRSKYNPDIIDKLVKKYEFNVKFGAGIEPYVKIPYLIVVFAMMIWGILILALQNSKSTLWVHCKDKVSLGLSTVGTILFVISLEPYAAMFTFVFLLIKALMLIKWA